MPDPAALTTLVLWLGFGLAVLLGATLQRSHFCSMGAVADILSFGDSTRARAFGLALAVAIGGFGLLSASGQIDRAGSFYTAPTLQWGSHLVGGLMFGAGMVLGSGCGARTLVRIGGGNLKSLVVFLVMGIAAQATLRGITAVARDRTVDRLALELPARQDLPSLLHLGPGGQTALALGLAVLLAAGVLWRARWKEVLPGALVGLLLVAQWWVSGHLGFLPEHPDTLEPVYLATASHAMEGYNFVSPAAFTLDWLTYFSDRNRVLSVGIVISLGLVLGAGLSAWQSGQFRWESFRNPADLGRHLLGAVLMGVGGVTALGCSFGQGLSGLSTLALGSLISTLAIIAGAWAVLRWEAARLERLL
ncbi:YeeE/YedE family protein [Ideonella alba]|uniref:YeeE/YedE family protein n=1 Tax=Ideonella alba TaxID=2824118 RepID=A0A940YE70_9BURK|nr:YeeE/YedE family protein [Ideonella alba]MBQ0932950.1 YeeE/YedE family protein [Ideonella alba]